MKNYGSVAEAIEARKAYHPIETVYSEDEILNKMALRFTNDSTDEPLYTTVRLALVELRANAQRGKSTAKIIRVLHAIGIPAEHATEDSKSMEVWKPKGF